jgi:hypothetical protein
MSTVAICTVYQPSDTGAAAIRLADLLSDWGFTVFFAATSQHRRPLAPRWDSHVLAHSDYLAYYARELEIWLTPLPAHGAKERAVPYVVVHNQNFHKHWEPNFYEQAKHVICPDTASYRQFQKLRFGPRCQCLPWDSGLPLHSPRESDMPQLLLPLHQNYWRAIHPAYLKNISMLLSHFPDTQLTVLLPSKPPAHLWKAAKRLARQRGVQVQLKPIATPMEEWTAFTDADLVLWPADLDAFGRVPQLAIAAGAAVCTWADESHVDLIGPKHAELLVPARQPLTAEDHKRYFEKVSWLLRHPQQLAAARSGLHAHQYARREKFVRNWADLLSELV